MKSEPTIKVESTPEAFFTMPDPVVRALVLAQQEHDRELWDSMERLRAECAPLAAKMDAELEKIRKILFGMRYAPRSRPVDLERLAAPRIRTTPIDYPRCAPKA